MSKRVDIDKLQQDQKVEFTCDATTFPANKQNGKRFIGDVDITWEREIRKLHILFWPTEVSLIHCIHISEAKDLKLVKDKA